MTSSESDVLSAIDALERDEIGELVTWQIEQGKARGDGPEDATPYEYLGITCHGLLEHIEQMLAAVNPCYRWAGEAQNGPHGLHRQLNPGEQVSWRTPDGEMRIGVVREHRQADPGGYEWTITIGD